MAQQSFQLPLPATVEVGTGDAIRIRWEDMDLRVDPELVSLGQVAYLRRFQLASLDADINSSQRILVRLAFSLGGDEGEAGPDLTEQFEQNWRITVGGRTYSHAQFGPLTAEPYLWLGNADVDIPAFRASILELVNSDAAEVTLTLDDGAEPEIVSFFEGEIEGGPPALTGDLTVTPPAGVALEGEISGQPPTLSGTLSSTPPGMVGLDGEIVSGRAELTGELSSSLPAKTTKTLVLSAPIAAAEGVAVGDLLAFGVFGSETVDGLIVGIEPGPELSARVSVLPFSAPGVYDSETGPIPPYVTGLTPLASGRYPLVIENLRSDESALRRVGSTLVPSVAVDVRPVDDADAMIEAQIRPHGDSPWEVAEVRSRSENYIELGSVVEGSNYDMRFRWSVPGMIFSGAWAEVLNHVIIGQTSPPPALADFRVNSGFMGFLARWTNPAAIDLAGVIVYIGLSDDFSAAMELGRVNGTYFVAGNLMAEIPVQVWARAVDLGGRTGPLSGPIEVVPISVAEGVGADGSGFEVIFRLTATEAAPANPVTTAAQRAQDDFVPADWHDLPQELSLQMLYQWVSVRVGSTGAWGEFSAPTVWARFGVDGAGVEFIFRLTATDAPPARPVTTAAQRAQDDFVPADWHDDPQALTPALPYQWISRRAGSTGRWEEFSAPVLLTAVSSRVHDIGGADVPAAALGRVGDTAFNDDNDYFYKTATGWEYRGTFTGEVYLPHQLPPPGTLPPPNNFGNNGDVAIGTDGRVMQRANGVWADHLFDIPAPTNLTAVYTIIFSNPSDISATIYELRVQWTGRNYIAEVDLGVLPSADLTDTAELEDEDNWRELDGLSATDFHYFRAVNRAILVGQAARVRFIGLFGQRSPWAYVFYSPDTTFAIEEFSADNEEVESGDTVTLRWRIRNADSASIDQGVGAIANADLEDGSRTVNVTQTTTFRLTAIRGTDMLTEDVTITVAAALAQPRIVTFAPDDSAISPGATTRVRWTLENVVSGRITGPALDRALVASELAAGNIEVGPFSAGNQNFTLTVNGVAGTTPASTSFTIVVTADPVRIDTFTRDDATIEAGESTRLRWTTSNASGGVTLNGAAVNQDGSMLVSPVADTDYELIANGPGGPVSQTITVSVTQPAAQIDSFTADDTTPEPDENFTLSWTTTGATRVRLLTYSGFLDAFAFVGGDRPADGSYTSSFAADNERRYRIRAYNADGDYTESATITIRTPALPDPDPVTIDTFTRDDATIERGESTRIRWTTSNATGVTLNGAAVNQDGSMLVSPTADTDYELIANGPGGPVSQTITVEVTEPPPPPTDPEVVSFAASDTSIEPGESVVLNWVTRNGDNRQLQGDPIDGPVFTVIDRASASGSRTVSPNVTTTYRISVWNTADPSGTVDSQDVTVTVTHPAAQINSFSASDTTPDPNENFTLTWATTGATRVRLASNTGFFGAFVAIGGDRPVDGSYTTSLPANTERRYQIWAYNAANARTVSSTVTVETGA